MFRSIIRKIRGARFKYEHLVEVRVSAGAIRHNLATFRKTYSKIQFAPVLKANAYGHGLVEVAKILDTEKVPFLAVDSYFEAMVLRNERIKTPVLILGYTPIGNIVMSRLPEVAFTIVSMAELRALSATLEEPRQFHLKMDTGMHRQGILWNEVPEAIAFLKQNQNIELVGALSHFASAEGENEQAAEEQIDRWNQVVQKLRKAFPEIRYTHMPNTGGSHYTHKIDANTARLGVGLYGMDPHPERALSLLPALELRSVIASVKRVPAGGQVGYSGTFTAPKEITVATVPVGYSEGIERGLSNQGVFLVRGQACPILGRVSMNITTIDVSALPEVKLGEPVVAISADPSAANSVDKIAEMTGRLQREVLVHIPGHLKRVVVE